MIVLTGKSCSGKDSIARELTKMGFDEAVTYTTRPIRSGEKEGVNYYFKTKKQFKTLIDNDFFAEWRTYSTVEGIWFYGSSKESYRFNKNKFIVLPPSGIKKIKETCPELQFTSFYIDAADDVILKRMQKRDKNNKESARRFKSDQKDFVGIEHVVDFTLTNNGLLTPKDIAKIIIEANIGTNQLKE